MDKKSHAEHNENACKFLHSDGNYCDWVVTTAFYSALHLVQHEIFPINVNGLVYDSFDKYYNGHYQGVKNRPNKHVSTINLVKAELGVDVHQNYSWLYGLCMNARYADYNIHKFIAEESIKRLERIKGLMIK